MSGRLRHILLRCLFGLGLDCGGGWGFRSCLPSTRNARNAATSGSYCEGREYGPRVLRF